MLLVHSAPSTLERHRHPNLGVLCSPRRVYRDVAGWDWAADNDAYSNWDEGRYRDMLQTVRELPAPLFVTAPDVVGDWLETLVRYETWRDELAGLPVAYVLQDGQPYGHMPWDGIAAVFVGGSSVFKMGTVAHGLVIEAKRRDLWVHMGRVNTHQRLRYAKAIGCDSVDGTGFSWFRDRWLPEFLDHAAGGRQFTFPCC